MKLSRLLKDEWCIAYRPKKPDITLLEDTSSKFRVVKNSWRYWCADPFAITGPEGRTYLFFEAYDRLRGKGVVGVREIKPNGRIGKLRIVFQSSTHLSYPFIFRYEDQFYMIPESNQANNLILLKAKRFPDQWETVRVLLNDVKICDATFTDYSGNIFLFATPIADDNVSRLNLYFSENGRISSPVTVIDDASRARTGGKFFNHNNETYRVSQNCEKFYGSGIWINRVESIDRNEYRETPVKEISIKDVKIDSPIKNAIGIHTYNFNENFETVDIKISRRFAVANLIGYALRKFGRKK